MTLWHQLVSLHFVPHQQDDGLRGDDHQKPESSVLFDIAPALCSIGPLEVTALQPAAYDAQVGKVECRTALSLCWLLGRVVQYFHIGLLGSDVKICHSGSLSPVFWCRSRVDFSTTS